MSGNWVLPPKTPNILGSGCPLSVPTFHDSNMFVGHFIASYQDLDEYLTYMEYFKTSFRSKDILKRHLERVTLGRSSSDMDRRVERLWAPDSSLEFLRYIAQLTSNGISDFHEQKAALQWIGVQSDLLLKKMFASPFPTVQASFDRFLQLSVSHRKNSCFKLLARSIPKSWLTGKRLTQILLGALELEVDDIARKILSTEIDVKSCLFTSWGDRGKRVTYLGAVRSAEIAQLILEKGADVNEASWYLFAHCYYAPIYHALLRGNIALAQLFLDSSANFDPNFIPVYNDETSKMTLLGNAIKQQDIRTTRWLLAKGARCIDYVQNFACFCPRTELQQIVVAGNTEILSSLLANEATRKILRSGVCKAAPLHEAAARGQVEMVKLLIKAGADANAEMSKDKWDRRGRPLF